MKRQKVQTILGKLEKIRALRKALAKKEAGLLKNLDRAIRGTGYRIIKGEAEGATRKTRRRRRLQSTRRPVGRPRKIRSGRRRNQPVRPLLRNPTAA